MTSTLCAKPFLALILSCCVLAPALASESAPLSITATPGKSVCASNTVSIAQIALPSEICVLSGNFSHDKYSLKIDGKTVVQGIDDQTTEGIASTYKGQTASLLCAPQEIRAKETPEATLADVQRVMPNATPEEAATMVRLVGTGPMGIEIGRLCTASLDAEPFMTVQVLFK